MSARKETKSELAAALKEAGKTPQKEELWDRLEEMAAKEQKPDEVAELYRKVIRETKAPDVVALVAPRALRFHEEWYGVKADELAEILGRVLELDPNAEWALRRLSVFYTVKERWNDLLALYDRALAAVDDGAYRRELLTEAVRVAKDFVGDSDRTIVYLTELHRLSPADAHLAGQLERLLERQGRWQALVGLWSARLAALPAAEARALRIRAAGLHLEKLNDPAGALAELAPVLAQGEADEPARALAERILRAPKVAAPVRRQALELLRARYRDEVTPAPLVGTLEAALEFADPGEQAALHREMAERLAAGGERKAAIEHLRTLLTLTPGDDRTVARLRQLSEGEGDPQSYVRGLDAAAAATEDPARRVQLWMEAARMHEEGLHDTRAAITYYRQAFREDKGNPALRLDAARKLIARLAEVPDAAEAPGERLALLEALAAELGGAAANSPERRGALVEAARLAEERGDVERAAMAFGQLVEMDPADRAGLDGLTSLLERAQRWEPLAAALRRRVASAGPPAERRADLVRLARLQAGPLAEPAAAVDTWLDVQKAFGEDVEVTEALTELYTVTGRWGELAELLSKAGEREGSKLTDVMCRLGDAYRERLADPRRAMDCYARALQASPGHAGALAGVRALLEVPSCRTAAADALARTYDASGDWMALLDLLELRLHTAPDDAARVRLLMEAAALAERKANDPAAALTFVARALPLAPDEAGPERDLFHLSSTTRNFRVVVEALRAAAAATRDPLRAARLRLSEGQLDEQELGDLPAALEAFKAAYEREPSRPEVRESLVRVAARSGRWDLAAQAALAPGVTRDQLERTLLPLLEGLAAEAGAGAHAALAEAAGAVLSGPDRPLDPGLARDLDVRLARWCQLGGEATAAGAEVALARAATQARVAREGAPAAAGSEGLQAGEAEILRRLAEAQRRKPGRALCETLLQLADLTPGDLDPLREAAAVALKIPAAEPLAGTILARLHDQATRLLRAGTASGGRAAADEATAWSVGELVRMQLERSDRSAWGRAVELLLDATRLPLGKDVIRQLRWRAAELSVDKLRDRRTAISALRHMVEDQPDDQEALHRLASLYDDDKRLPELLALRADELGRTQQVDRRLTLRLEMEKIAAALEERSGRLDMLRANLEEQPGHRATIETLARVLEAKGRHGELVDILGDQATRLEERGDGPSAARLWDWSAHILEQPIGDRERAIRAYEKVGQLGPRPETFESLGRLMLDKGDALGAAVWLERWQDAAQGGVRTRAALELAGAYLAADKRARAVACLERALGEDPRAGEVRARLVELYRKSESWEPLTRVLNDGTAYSGDKEAILSSAREAADISQRHLGSPLAALGALERAVGLYPEDSSLRSLFAEALAAAGEQGRAREILEGLIKESGRRRSRERAALHHRLARVARAEGKADEALAQLEQAADMDTENAGVLEALGEVADSTGDTDRAERAYRALVLLARRGGKGASLSTSETLLRLRRIALHRKQDDKAQDLLDSAITDAIASPEEARRLADALRAEGARDVLRTVLDRRLAAASDPAQQAPILAEQAELLEAEGNKAEALEALMSALSKAPEVAAIRQAARRVARETKASARLVDSLQALAGERRRTEDAGLHAALLAEGGEAALGDLEDQARASELWSQAAQAGVDGGPAAVEAAFRLARLHEGQGAKSERSKALKLLARFGKAGVPVAIRTEGLFRLAEAQMVTEDSRDQGLAALASALELSGDVERAFALVRGANVPDADLPRVLPLYERVARSSKDERMLLDFLERKAALPTATFAEVREGVELALGRSELKRAEALLERAAGLARSEGQSNSDRKALEWALLELAEVRRRSGNLAGAVAALEDAGDVADPARVLRLYQDLARRALEEGGDPAAAAKVYERLWEREPSERRTWEPLLAVYARMGDRANVERVAKATADRLFDQGERNAVRLARARFLAAHDRKDPALVEVLRDVLADQPTHQEAIELLADVYQATGNEEGLTDLLMREIESARARKDVPALVALSLRLGQRLLDAHQPGEARDVYRRALDASPDDVPTLRALSRLLSPTDDARERAVVLERLLENESGPAAGSLAIELSALHEALGDEERMRRALEVGVARAGGDQPVFQRLGEFYRSRHAYDRLAILMVEESERRSSPADKAALLKEAADIHRNSLARPRDAAELLRQARRFAPRDVALLSDLVGSLDALGERNTAIEELTSALHELPAGNRERLLLLQTRADMRESAAEYEAAVADREEAYRAGGEALQPALRETLQRWRSHASERGDAASERRAALRLHELLSRSGDEAGARTVLADWCYRHPEDAESLRLLVASDQAAQRWDAVVESAFRLIEVETGAAQISAAQLLVEACERLGQPAPAIAGLEAALRVQPQGNGGWLFETLMGLYDRAGERRKQAALLLWAGERNPDPEMQYQALRQAGEIFLNERDMDNATAAFQRAIALKPADRELSMLVAQALIEGGKHAEAEEILESHMKRAAKDLTSVELSSLQYRMAKLAEARGDQDGRLDWLRKAFDTNRKNAPVAIELADLAESVNDTDLAVKALRAVTLLPPSSAKLTPAMAFLRQARIAQRTGDRPRAVIFAKRALQEDPRLSDAVDFLRELGERRA